MTSDAAPDANVEAAKDRAILQQEIREGIAPPSRRRSRRLHPLPLRIMHWVNAVTIFVMIGSGWKIYNDEVIFGWLHFPEWLTLGQWAQHGLLWHFAGMWIFVINGLCYLTYTFSTGRFVRMLLPVHWPELKQTVVDSLHFKLAHEDTTRYNAVQKLLYMGVIAIGLLAMISGLSIWKPIQFSFLLDLFGNFQNARIVHFLCMSGIVGFITIHVALALLVPKTIVAMVAGGPVVRTDPVGMTAEAH